MSIARNFAFTLLAAATLLAGCEHVTERIPMEIGLREAHVEKIQWNFTRFIINAEITLKGTEPATMETADYSLKVGDTVVATGSTRVSTPLIPGQPVIVGLPVEINYQRFIEAVKTRKDLLLPSGDVSATLAGKVTAHGKFGQLVVASAPTDFESAVALPVKQEIWTGATAPITIPK